jgi:hypothetical protein
MPQQRDRPCSLDGVGLACDNARNGRAYQIQRVCG